MDLNAESSVSSMLAMRRLLRVHHAIGAKQRRNRVSADWRGKQAAEGEAGSNQRLLFRESFWDYAKLQFSMFLIPFYNNHNSKNEKRFTITNARNRGIAQQQSKQTRSSLLLRRPGYSKSSLSLHSLRF